MEKIEIPIQKIMGEVGYCFAWMLTWKKTNLEYENDFRSKQEGEWEARLNGIISVVQGTHFLPFGEPQLRYCGYYVAESIVKELKTDKYWPEWFDSQLLEE